MQPNTRKGFTFQQRLSFIHSAKLPRSNPRQELLGPVSAKSEMSFVVVIRTAARYLGMDKSKYHSVDD